MAFWKVIEILLETQVLKELSAERPPSKISRPAFAHNIEFRVKFLLNLKLTGEGPLLAAGRVPAYA